MQNPSLLALIKPYAWLALAAFVLGFGGTVAVTWPESHDAEAAAPSLASSPSADDWNLPKHT